MDPYIEPSGLWGDFHGSMLASIRGELNARLPEGYVASIEVYVMPRGPGPVRRARRRREPDVYVSEEKARETGTAVATAAAPRTIVFPSVERKRRKLIRIEDVQSRRVVTVVELLSPTNKKSGPDREAFLAKRDEYLANQISLVEIDLLRRGRRPPLGLPEPEIADYYIMVCRSWEYPSAGFWSFSVRDPLPEIPVPLAQDVPDTLLPLRPCMDRAYDEGRYGTRLPYEEPLRPRLSRQDDAWVQELLANRPR
jgi:hypothetical protein